MQAITAVLGGMVLTLAAAPGGPVAGGPAAAPSRTADPARPAALVLVLDASVAMGAPDGHGSTKLRAVRAALRTTLAKFPADLRVGLRVYGNRVPSAPDRSRACQDTELVAPVVAPDRGRLAAAVERLGAGGEAPLGLSLGAAARDLPAGASGSIVVVSAGADSCAPAQACQVARQLNAAGVRFTVDTVGLRVDAAAATQLSCISQATGGTFTDVQDPTRLAESLAVLVTRATRTATEGARPIRGGPTPQEAPTLSAGRFTDGVAAGRPAYYAVDLAAGQTVTVRLTLDALGLPAVADTGCCLLATLQDASGEQLGFANDVPDAGRLTTMELATREPLDQPATVFLELANKGGTTRAGQSLPVVVEVVVAGPGAVTGPDAGSAPVADPGSPPGVAAPAVPAVPAAGDGLLTAPAVLGTVGLLAVVAGCLGAVLVVRRRSGRTVTGPGTPPASPAAASPASAAPPAPTAPAARAADRAEPDLFTAPPRPYRPDRSVPEDG